MHFFAEFPVVKMNDDQIGIQPYCLVLNGFPFVFWKKSTWFSPSVCFPFNKSRIFSLYGDLNQETVCANRSTKKLSKFIGNMFEENEKTKPAGHSSGGIDLHSGVLSRFFTFGGWLLVDIWVCE